MRIWFAGSHVRFTAVHLAWQNFRESRSSALFLVGAVAAGVGFQVPNTANLDGYHAELMAHGVESGFGDVRVRAAGLQTIEDGRELAERLRADPRVEETVPAITLPGAIGNDRGFRAALLLGVDMTRAAMPFRLLDGASLAPGDDSGVVVGSALAGRLGLAPGDEVEVRVIFATSDDDLDDSGGLGRYTMTVRGLAAGTFGASQAVYVDLDFLARETGMARAASHVYVYLHDHAKARAVAADIQVRVPDIEATAWLDDDRFIASALASSRAISVVSETMVVFAVGIPVLALLYIHVLRRRRDIGLLAAIGFAPREIFGVFLLQASIVAVAGIALGCGLGYSIIAYFQEHAIFAWEGFVIRPRVSLGAFARPAIVVFVITLVAGVFPAWRAARVHPARVLRGVE